MLNNLTLEERRDLWEWFVALSIAAVLGMAFLIVKEVVSAPKPEPYVPQCEFRPCARTAVLLGLDHD